MKIRKLLAGFFAASLLLTTACKDDEIFENDIRPYYNIDYVLDDRNQVVEMWRSIGLTCLQVAEGNF